MSRSVGGATGERVRVAARRGQAVMEYAAVVAIVVAVVLTLTAVRSQRAGKVPINPITSIGALVKPVPRPRPPRVAPRAGAPRPARVRRVSPRPRPRVQRPVVTVPRWAPAP